MTAFHTRASVLPLNEKHGYFQYADAQGDVSLEFANGAVQLFISLGQEATRAYEQTGLTPAQLQVRVAELEGALAARQVRYDLISEFARRENVSYNSLCALVREATGQ